MECLILQDLDETFNSYSSFESRFGNDQYTDNLKVASGIVAKTKISCTRRDKQESLLRESGETLEAYMEYINLLKKWSLKQKQNTLEAEITLIYWRAIQKHYWNPLIWNSFLDFLKDSYFKKEEALKSGSGVGSEIEHIAFRAIKNSFQCMTNTGLWVHYLLIKVRVIEIMTYHKETNGCTWESLKSVFQSSIPFLSYLNDISAISHVATTLLAIARRLAITSNVSSLKLICCRERNIGFTCCISEIRN